VDFKSHTECIWENGKTFNGSYMVN